MSAAETEELVAKGLAALDNGHTHLALVCFERAAEIERSPLVCSSLGFCRAAARGELDRGIDLCREAIGKEPGNTLHYRNLGRVLLLAGRKDEALLAFRQGLRVGRDEGMVRELDALGTRKPAVIGSLHRDHFLNKWLGILLSWVGFR
ncbi:MAG: hypothetical protein NDI77_13380 [Geobacteraceae bacterium]|nr:hypothetical protein [Geobacteraceae bacterium]